MQREGWTLKGRGDYVLGTIRYTSFNTRVREERMHIDHQMVLAELRGGIPQRNDTYRMQRQGWTINPHTVRPLTEGEAAFAALKEEVDKKKRQKKAQESWISLDIW